MDQRCRWCGRLFAVTSGGRLKITPLDSAVPDEAHALTRQASSLLPHLKITELLLEVDDWTGFTRHFLHLKSGEGPKTGNCC